MVLPTQHPAQLLGVHEACPSQNPPAPSDTHTVPLAEQFEQTCPLIPQAVAAVPGRHS